MFEEYSKQPTEFYLSVSSKAMQAPLLKSLETISSNFTEYKHL